MTSGEVLRAETVLGTASTTVRPQVPRNPDFFRVEGTAPRMLARMRERNR